jgi:hypothetical protein
MDPYSRKTPLPTPVETLNKTTHPFHPAAGKVDENGTHAHRTRQAWPGRMTEQNTVAPHVIADIPQLEIAVRQRGGPNVRIVDRATFVRCSTSQ